MDKREYEMDESLKRAFEQLSKMDTVSPDELPTMDLYMDQLTTLMDKKLRGSLRHPTDDKILTKTMINNYAKNDLIPPPVKKKYTREHIFELLFIFYFKSFLSIGDIQTLLSPMTANFFGKDKEFGLEEVYSEMLKIGHGSRENLKGQMEATYQRAKDAFEDAPEEYRDYLRKFSYVCQLGYDIYLKKNLIERLIDEISDEFMLDALDADEYLAPKKAAKEASKEAARVAREKEERKREQQEKEERRR